MLLISRLSYKVSFPRLHSTLLPQASGRRTWTAAGWVASRGFHPRQDLCRLPSLLAAGTGQEYHYLWQGSWRNSPPQAVFRTDVTALHLRWPYLIKAEEFTAISPCLQVVLAHPPASLSPLVKGACQERIQIFGYEIVKEHKRCPLRCLLLFYC